MSVTVSANSCESPNTKLETRFLSWYLNKYLSREILFSFLGGTMIFLLIMLMFQAIRLAEFVVIHQVSLSDVGRLCIYLMLDFVPIAVTIAFLFSVLMGIARANSEGEILALQVNGFSLAQIFFPVGVFSVLVSTVCLFAALYAVPLGNRAFELLITKLNNQRVMAALKPGVFVGFHGLVLFTEEIIPIKNEMKKVFLYDERDENYPLAITAEAGILRNMPEKGLLTLRLTNGSIHIDRKWLQTIQQKIDFDVYDINLALSSPGDAWRDYSPQSFTYRQLKLRIAETVHDVPQNRRLQAELHSRFSLAFSCIVFAALGFFIGTLSQRGVRSSAIIFCMAVGLIYWLSYITGDALASSGTIPPWLGIWFPNFFFSWVAWLCYRRYGRG